MQLVACSQCGTQYDVSDVDAKTFPCRCGAVVENQPPSAADAQVLRCASCGALTASDALACDFCGAAIAPDDTRLLSLICPACYARNEENARFCCACGVVFRPEPIPSDGEERGCPVCSVPMPVRSVGGITVNECGRCGGLWVPDRNFDRLVARAVKARQSADPAQLLELAPRVTGANPAAQQVHYRQCPVCDAHMQRRNFRKASGVIVDRCASHGTWLDAAELEQIAGYILSGRQPSEVLTRSPEPRGAVDRSAVTAALRRHQQRSAGRSREGGLADSLVDALIALFE